MSTTFTSTRLMQVLLWFHAVLVTCCGQEVEPGGVPVEGTGTPAPGEDGAPCRWALECLGGTCLTESESGYVNGYCTSFQCQPSGCHGGSCIAYSDGTSMCRDTCDVEADCRAGYHCTPTEEAQVCDPIDQTPPEAPSSTGSICLDGCQPGEPVRIDCGYVPSLWVLSATYQWGMPYDLDQDAAGFAVSVWPEQAGHQINLVSIRNELERVLQLKGIDSALNVTSFRDNQFVTVTFPFAPRCAEFLDGRTGILQVQSTAETLCMALSQGPGGDTLQVRIYLVGASGLSADTMVGDADYVAMMAEWQHLFALASISVRDGIFIDAAQADVDRYRIIREESDVRGVLSLTEDPARNPDGGSQGPMMLNLVLVDDLMLTEHPEAVGQAGLLPGPPGLHGTGVSGIVAEMSSFREDPPRIGLIIAHEAAHFLGLRHTSELFTDPIAYGRTDPLPDTPECSDVLALWESCPDHNNLMFPLLLSDRPSSEVQLSAQQAWVLQHNPLVRPDRAP